MNRTSTVPGETLRVPGARLHYEVRGHGPLVLLTGSPMDARSFEPLADLLADDYTVLTTDPRGIYRSPVDDPEQDSTPRLRAEDLSALLAHLNAGPAAVLGSSGGAISALALAQAHPEQVHTVIAHEPGIVELLDDREEIYRQTEDIIATYVGGDIPGAWKKFMAQANISMPDDMLEHMFGADRDPQVLADEHRWITHELRQTDHWRPDLDVLRTIGTRIVVGIGEDSGGELCERTGMALANELSIEPIRFPGGHTGFAEQPDDFVGRLRAVLRG